MWLEGVLEKLQCHCQCKHMLCLGEEKNGVMPVESHVVADVSGPPGLQCRQA
jgi:hypothetical protein